MLGPGRISTDAFRSLMESVAAGWNAGDARKAANCFTEEPPIQPPDRQLYAGRAALYEFFGGAAKPEPPMRMKLAPPRLRRRVAGRLRGYTFQMNRRYHGIVVVRIRGGKIASWREYQYESPLDWKQFIRKSEP